MKITGIECYLVRPRWCFLEITTDDGYTGWGEAILEGRAATVKTAVEEVTPSLIGCDPMRVEDIWEMLYRGGFYRGGGIMMSAISGIDQALWDIRGKRFGVPVYELLGGRVRDKVKMYAAVGGGSPEAIAADAKRRMDEGFTAIKIGAVDYLQYIDTYDKMQPLFDNLSEIRRVCGSKLGVGVDCHGRVHKPMAKVLVKKLEQFDLLFVEEPVLCDNWEDFREIARVAAVPIATGERVFTKWQFKKLLEDGCVDVLQPDLSHAGGITEVKKIAAMAEAYDVALAPHCPLGPLALMACVQIDMSCHNAVIQEQAIGTGHNPLGGPLDYVKNRSDFDFSDGWFKIPSVPGIGAEVNRDLVIEENKNPHAWKNPLLRHSDGSVAEW